MNHNRATAGDVNHNHAAAYGSEVRPTTPGIISPGNINVADTASQTHWARNLQG